MIVIFPSIKLRPILISFGITAGIVALWAGIFTLDIRAKVAKLPVDLRLKTETENIIDSKAISSTTVQYKYISNTTPPEETLALKDIPAKTLKTLDTKIESPVEDINKRTKNSRAWKIGEKDGKDVYQAKIYSGDTFYKKDNEWYAVNYATTTNQAFALQTTSLIEKAYATDFVATYSAYMAGEDIDDTEPYEPSYAAARADVDGICEVCGYDINVGQYYVDYGSLIVYGIARGFLKFDTSSIGSGSNVTAVTMTLTPSVIYGQTYIVITENDWSSYDPLSSNTNNTSWGSALGGSSYYFNYNLDLAVDTPDTSEDSLTNNYVNKTGSTYYSLVNLDDIQETPPDSNDVIRFYEEIDSEVYRPYLNVTYTPLTAPTVTTPTVTDVGYSEARFGANVTAGYPLPTRGTCWGYSASPTTNCLADGTTDTGVFTQWRYGLPRNTLIYYRGYATNSEGTSYSADGSTTTLMTLPPRASTASTSPTGGTITYSGGKTIHKFTSSDTFTVPAGASGNVEVLVVAGGGGGGGTYHGGGGGAGGLIYNSSFAVTAQGYYVTVGGGGAGGTFNVRGTNGDNSVFSTITATGGGGGGSYNAGGGKNGGSGGGPPYNYPTSVGTGIVGQGYNGGPACSICSPNYGSGGGGGAGAVGGTGTATTGGNGGVGLAYSISGSSVYYAGGGGGSTYSAGTPGSGGLGGGGAGSTGNATSADPNTGGGGGGAERNGTTGGNGGSGVVIISYTTGSIVGTITPTKIFFRGNVVLRRVLLK